MTDLDLNWLIMLLEEIDLYSWDTKISLIYSFKNAL